VSGKRRLFATSVVLALIAGHAAALIAQAELYPFSPYPMYSKIRGDWQFTQYRLAGVRDGGEVEITDWRLLQPYGSYGLSAALRRLDESPRRAELGPVLHGLLETRLPRSFTALRLYKMRFQASRELDPRRGDRAPLLSRELIAESAR
jgi:hypothetical protein